VRQTKRPFLSLKSFSNHIQHASECKAYVYDQQSAMSTTASTCQLPPQRAGINSTSQLFKKQRLRFNPTFTEHEYMANNTNEHIITAQAMDDDDHDCFSDDDSSQSDFSTDDNSFAFDNSDESV
jgi:hypothetical protein